MTRVFGRRYAQDNRYRKFLLRAAAPPDPRPDRKIWRIWRGPSMVPVAMLGLFLVMLIVPVQGHAESCLTIQVPPQAVVSVADGDTFSVFNLFPPGYVRVRLEGVNTPERKEPGYLAARDFTAAWLASRPFTLYTCGKRTFDRIVGTASRDGETLASALKAAGHSR